MSNILFPKEQLNRDRFRRLSVVEKLVFLHLYLCGENNAIGIFTYPSEEYYGFFPLKHNELIATLRALDATGLIRYFQGTDTVYIKGFSKDHISIFTHRNYFKGAEAAIKRIAHNKGLLEQWCLENLESLKASPMKDRYEKTLGFRIDALRPQTSFNAQELSYRSRLELEDEKKRRPVMETVEDSDDDQDEETDYYESDEPEESDDQ